MKWTKLKSGCDKMRQLHHDIIRRVNSYSMTFNITKNLANEHRQKTYVDSIKEIKYLFEKIGPFLNEVTISPEYNKNNQIHWHCYFDTKEGVTGDKLVDAIKYHITACRKVLWTDQGYGWKLKAIDELTEVLDNYPFKDIERGATLSKECYQPFELYHYHGTFYDNIILEKKTLNHKTLIKFNEFINLL